MASSCPFCAIVEREMQADIVHESHRVIAVLTAVEDLADDRLPGVTRPEDQDALRPGVRPVLSPQAPAHPHRPAPPSRLPPHARRGGVRCSGC